MSLRSLTLLAIAAGTASTLAAEDGPTNSELLRRIDELDQRVRISDRKAEIAAEEAAAKAKTAVVAKAGDDGFSIGTADGSYQLKLGVLIQADGRFWLNDGDSGQAVQQSNTFLIRRAIPTFDAKLGKYVTARLQSNFPTGSSAGLLEGWVNVKPSDALWFKVGRYKTLGVEYYANTAGLTFAERGLPTNLVPSYDVGATVGGGIGKVATWAIGVVNGAPDGGVRDTDNDDDKDSYAILTASPFAGDADSALAGLKLTLGASYGYETGALAGTSLPTYRSPGQVTVFQYVAPTGGTLANTAIALGNRNRIAPAVEYYYGSFGAFAEYTQSTQDVQIGNTPATLQKAAVGNSAWQATASYVLTGEKKTSNVVAPKKPFDPEAGTWGAWEVAVRGGQLSIDEAAFDKGFASRTASVKSATNLGVGVNWWLTKNLKWQLSYDRTTFEGGGGGTPTAPVDRETEQVFITRVQINY